MDANTSARSQLSDNTRLQRRPLSIHIERNWDPIISEFINLSQTRNARHRFIVRFDESKDRSIEWTVEEEEEKKMDDRDDSERPLLYIRRVSTSGGASDVDEWRSIARNFINVAIIVSSIASTDILFSLN